MTSPPSGAWHRIEEVESGGLIAFWFVLGLAMTAGCGYGAWKELSSAPPGLGIAVSLYNAIPWLLFFVVGLVCIAGSVYTVIDRQRNKLWLDIETPVVPGSKLRVRLASNLPLAGAGGVELEATLACTRRESESYTENGESKSRLVETPLWNVQRRFPLVGGLAACEFELDLSADAPPGDPGAEGRFSAQRGVFWVLGIYFQRNNVFVNRSYRIPVRAR